MLNNSGETIPPYGVPVRVYLYRCPSMMPVFNRLLRTLMNSLSVICSDIRSRSFLRFTLLYAFFIAPSIAKLVGSPFQRAYSQFF